MTAQLIDGSSGYDVWSQTYNRTSQDLLAIEDDLARSIPLNFLAPTSAVTRQIRGLCGLFPSPP